MHARLQDFARALRGDGLQLVAPVSSGRAAALWIGRGTAARALRGTATLVVCGSGGRAHWETLAPAQQTRAHPIDAAGWAAIDRALPLLPPRSRRLPNDVAQSFDLRRLAEAAGFGKVSPYLHLLLHPEFGSWVSLRGVVAVPEPIGDVAPTDFDPCTSCDRPCLSSCPAAAYAPEQPFSAQRCGRHRLQEQRPAEPCADFCRVRLACPVGRDHAYSAAEYRHRHRANLASIREYWAHRPPPTEP
ncbi:MAG: hypothetical protein AAF628_03605 [Planctomycetota bacterium]